VKGLEGKDLGFRRFGVERFRSFGVESRKVEVEILRGEGLRGKGFRSLILFFLHRYTSTTRLRPHEAYFVVAMWSQMTTITHLRPQSGCIR
jgi:hypothetical protein